jgi:serine/threonine-protein kinase
MTAVGDLPGAGHPPQVGNYEVLGPLGRGGMAEVFLARRSGTAGHERLAVLKRILPAYAGTSVYRRMFIDEARLAALLHHPNICRTYEFFFHEGKYWLAMEFIAGRNLGEALSRAVGRRRSIPLDVTLHVIGALCEGLHHAHELRDESGGLLGIVHRDVNPTNVMIGFDGSVKLLDFGVAKAEGRRADTTVAGGLKGKVAYMSPEQCRGKPVDRRTDVFALGILLYELTTGARLFDGETEVATLNQIVNQPIPPPSRRVPGYSPQLEAILLRALSYAPDDRFSTASELGSALAGFATRHGAAPSTAATAALMAELFEPGSPPSLATHSGTTGTVEEARSVAAIPLAYRLPNPPAVFLGRNDQVASLAELVERGTVAVVWGPGGIGKSALVSATLQARFSAAIPRVVHVDLLDTRHGDLVAQIARPLLAAVQGTSDGSLATLLDLAEDLESVLFIDDLHKARPDQVRELLTAAARFARRSRWIATSRERIDVAELAGQQLQLETLDTASMTQLAQALVPTLDTASLARVVEGAAGSPWRLKQGVLGRSAGDSEIHDVFAGLSARALDCARLLWAAGCPVVEVDLGAYASVDQALLELDRRSLALRHGTRWRLHDVARQELSDRLTAGEQASLRRKLLDAWTEHPPADGASRVALIGLALAADSAALALARLDRYGDALLADGLAPELWAALSEVSAASLAAWRLRVAIEAGPIAFDAIAPIAADAPVRMKRDWALLALRRGDAVGAARAALDAAREATSELDAADCRLLAARAFIDIGRVEEARLALGAERPSSPEQACCYDAVLAALELDRDRAHASDIVDRAVELVWSLEPGSRRLAVRLLARSLFELGRLLELEKLIAALEDASESRDLGRQWIYIKSCLSVPRGRLDEASALFERIRPAFAPESSIAHSVRAFDAAIRLAQGRFDGLAAELADLRATVIDPTTLAGVLTLDRRTAIALGQPATEAPQTHPGATPSSRALLEAIEAEHCVRSGLDVPDPGEVSFSPESAVGAARCRATRAMVAGAFRQAVTELNAAIGLCEKSGHLTDEAELLEMLWDARVLMDDRIGAETESERLATLGTRVHSPRMMESARLRLALQRGMEADELLDGLRSPLVPYLARRIESLLSSDRSKLDRIDALVVQALAGAWVWQAVGDPTSTLWWVADLERMTVRGAAGVLDLSATPLMTKLIWSLARHGGEASVETLLSEVWEIESDHRLRHDNRARTAMRSCAARSRASASPVPSRPGIAATGSSAASWSGGPRIRERVAPAPLYRAAVAAASSGWKRQMSQFPPSFEAKYTQPSEPQCGWIAMCVPAVSWVKPVPSARMAKRFDVVAALASPPYLSQPRFDENRMYCPSGDHAGHS